jgi:outer membrane protein assembly factor BamB
LKAIKRNMQIALIPAARSPFELRLSIALLGLIALVNPAGVQGGDWPQILGPNRDGHAAADEKIAATFPADGPAVLWSRKVGAGLAGPAVAGDKLILFHRLGDKEVVECLDAASGEPRWSFEYITNYRDDFGFDDGPRAVPTLSGERIYTYGAAGMLHCIDLSTGKPVWKVDTVAEFKSDKGFFGRACSPLVEGEHVIVQIGGASGAGIIALDKNSGATRWRATSHEAGYSSPIATTIGDRRAVIALTRHGLVVLDASDGRILFEQRFRSSQNASVNAATPIVTGHTIFLTASYNTGAAMFHLSGSGAQRVWANDESLSSQYATPVHHDGMLYGLHGRQDAPPKPMLRCIEAATGKVQWSTPPLAAGSLIMADDKLIVLTEEGELILAPANPDGFSPAGRAQILGGNVRALPALSRGRLYARDPRQLVCVDLTGGAQ